MVVQAQAEANTFPENGRQPGDTRIGWSRSEAWMGVQIPPSTRSHARRRRDAWRNWKQSTGPGDYKSISVLSIEVGRWAHGLVGGGVKGKMEIGSSICIITSSKVKRIKWKLTGSCVSANGPSVGDNESIVSVTE